MTTLKTMTWLLGIASCLLFIKPGHPTIAPGQTNTLVGSAAAAFTCAGKVIGGYYADVQANCQMFHVCTIGENGEIRDIVFGCLEGTVFDQETRVCERQGEVDCSQSSSFYHLNNDLYGPGIIPDTATALKRGPEQPQPRPQTQRQNHLQLPLRDTLKTTATATATTTTTPTTKVDHSSCKGLKRALLQPSPRTGCKAFHVCIPQHSHSELRRAFVCADEGYRFDSRTGHCSREADVPCSKPPPADFELSLDEAEVFAVHTLGLCSFFGRGTFIVDTLHACGQYFRCPTSLSAALKHVASAKLG